MDRPTSFETSHSGSPSTVVIEQRPGVSEADASRWLDALAATDWGSLQHAYGDASDVPAQLFAVAVGTDQVREPAWWELWGDIHHQGTVYEATVPAVRYLDELAAWNRHPDRVEALSFLRQLAVGNGSYGPAVREAVEPVAAARLASWRDEPELIQRALAWLATAFPDLSARQAGLAELVPAEHRQAWAEVAARSGYPLVDADDFEEQMDREDGLERWALAGWPESRSSS